MRSQAAIAFDQNYLRQQLLELAGRADALLATGQGDDAEADAITAEINAARQRMTALSSEMAAVWQAAGYETEHPGTARPDVHSREADRRRYTNRGQLESQALRAVQAHQASLSAPAADRLDRVIRDTDNDPTGAGARYLAAVANDDYQHAFFTLLAGGSMWDITREEAAALREVRLAQAFRAQMNEGTGSAGGYGVPFTLDPSIIETADNADSGAIRGLATIKTIATNEWRGVSADAVTSGYVAELTDASDGSPTFAQPKIVTQRWQAWLQYSIELGADYVNLGNELFKLLRSALRANEAVGFITGDPGSDEPDGLVHALDADGTSKVDSTTANTLTVPADAYLLQGALPARFQAGAVFLAHPSIIGRFFQTTPTTDRPIITDARTVMLGRRLVEIPEMDATVTTGSVMAVYGNIGETFVIVDRIGMSVQPVPVAFNPSSGLPNGSSGLYAYARNGSGVVNFNASRFLKSKA